MRKILEIQTPATIDLDEFISGLTRFEDFDTVVIGESGGISAAAVAERVRQDCDKEIFLKIACRDRNRIALHSQLVTAAASGLLNLVLADGAHPIRTPFPDAKPVYELDALGLLRMIKRQAPGFGDGSLLSSMSWRIGVCVGGCTPADLARAKKFLEAEADLFFAHSLESVPRLRQLTDKPIFLSVAEEAGADFQETVNKAESAGADGINLIVEAPDRVSDASAIAKQR